MISLAEQYAKFCEPYDKEAGQFERDYYGEHGFFPNARAVSKWQCERRKKVDAAAGKLIQVTSEFGCFCVEDEPSYGICGICRALDELKNALEAQDGR